LVLLPIVSSNIYLIYNITGIFIWAVLALGLWINLKAQIFNFAPAGLMLIGAYTSGLLITKLNANFWLTLPAAIIMAIIFARLIGVVAFRTKGLYFVLITASFSQALVLAMALFADFTGGWSGPPQIPSPQLFGIDFSNKTTFYWLAFVFLVIVFLFCYRLSRSQIGKIYEFVGENDALAQSVGVPLGATRLQNFTVSAVLFALAGCFYGIFTNHIDPSTFGFDATIDPWFYIVMGGSGSIAGPLLGTAIVRYLRVLFGFMDQIQPIAVGVCVILIILFIPQGVVSIPERLKALFMRLSGKSD
jgi:branched-chain amino acid transport system permease protein